MANPIAAAFIIEALVLTVALSLIGSLAFALPVALLWRRRAVEGV
jgi:hypothetical protein